MLEAGAGAGWWGRRSGTGRKGCYSAGLRSDSRASPRSQIENWGQNKGIFNQRKRIDL